MYPILMKDKYVFLLKYLVVDQEFEFAFSSFDFIDTMAFIEFFSNYYKITFFQVVIENEDSKHD